MSIEYDYAVFMGRFAPVHGFVSDKPETINGHVKVMIEALKKADYLIVAVGSDNVSRNTRTPFTAEERIAMIKIATGNNPKILFTTISDFPYDDNRWVAGVQEAVAKVIKNHKKTATYTNKGWRDFEHRIALAGMFKDETSYYLNNFPQWSNSIAVQPGTFEGEILSATGIRNEIFNGELVYSKNVHPDVKKYIFDHMEANSEMWQRLISDWRYEQSYESVWGKGPHLTVDALVIQAGHVLLIRRGNEYGHGLYAIPGGFVNRERLRNAALRELFEETKLHIPRKVLEGSIVSTTLYDEPFRSNRSHIVTMLHKIVLANSPDGLPEVYGSDDAEKAEWFEISKLKEMRGMFFEDHGAMLSRELGIEI